MKIKLFLVAIIIIFSIISVVISSLFNIKTNIDVSCTQEAKICPDGSSVGRIGPNCNFAECPKTNTQTTVINPNTQNPNIVIPNISNTTKLNKKITISGISITPIEFISDSRCALDVQCVWAGTVEIRVKIESGTKIQESKLTLGSGINFLNTYVELKNVLPPPYSRVSIKSDDYYFEFSVVSAEARKNINIEKPIF